MASRGKAYRGSYVVHRKAFLKQVPVPAVASAAEAQLIKVVDELHSNVERLRAESDSALRTSLTDRQMILRAQAEGVITKALGLTDDDVMSVVG